MGVHWRQDPRRLDNVGLVQVGVNVGRHLDIGVSHEALSDPDVHATAGQLRAVFVPQAIRDEILRQGIRWD